MKLSAFKYLLGILLFLPFSAMATEEVVEKKIGRYQSAWDKLVPRYAKAQFAGSMGMISMGIGWNYYRNHWETDLLLGIVPKYSDKHVMTTFTVKQNYIPWRVDLGKGFSFEPLSCGLYLNTLLDRDFWATSPDKYPKGYYWFSTRVRFHVFVGERITFKLNPNKYGNRAITLFYELSSCDLYLINGLTNSYLKPSDYLSLSFGVKFQIL